MAASEHESGSQTATVTTEHTLNTTSPETTDGVFQFYVDVAAMAAGDTLEIRVKEKARSADTQRVAVLDVISHSQIEPLWISAPLILLHNWDFTIKQTAGTGRAFPWSIRTT